MCSCSKNYPLAPIHLFSKQIRSTQESFSYLKSFDIHDTSSLHAHYKLLPSTKNILGTHRFFLSTLFHFHCTLFRGLVGACVNPGSISHFVHSFVCPITHSFLDEFQPNLFQHFPHVCSTCHTVFSLKKTLECICERLLHCRLIFSITWTPKNDLQKLTDTQSILMSPSVVKLKKLRG